MHSSTLTKGDSTALSELDFRLKWFKIHDCKLVNILEILLQNWNIIVTQCHMQRSNSQSLFIFVCEIGLGLLDICALTGHDIR